MTDKSSVYKITLSVLAVLFIATSLSCAKGHYLQTVMTDNGDISGDFSVIYHGFNYSNDFRTVVILDREGDEYTIVPNANDYEYEIRKGVPAETALINARVFLRRNSYYRSSQTRKILNDRGQIIGYEIRPLYQAHAFGAADILNIYYRINENKVVFSVEIDRDVKKNYEDWEVIY